jgi:hypothetical protein
MATAHFDDTLLFPYNDGLPSNTVHHTALLSRPLAGSTGPLVALLWALWSYHVHGAGSPIAAPGPGIVAITVVKVIVRLYAGGRLRNQAAVSRGDHWKRVW